jgi:hypothetical protein
LVIAYSEGTRGPDVGKSLCTVCGGRKKIRKEVHHGNREEVNGKKGELKGGSKKCRKEQ